MKSTVDNPLPAVLAPSGKAILGENPAYEKPQSLNTRNNFKIMKIILKRPYFKNCMKVP